MAKVLLLNGGGTDSLAVALQLQKSGHETHSLHVDFGYPNSTPCKVAAELLATTYCASHKVITMFGLDAMGYDPTIDDRYRPIQYQQLVLSGIGCSHAQMNGIPYVVSGFRHRLLTNDFRPLFNNLLAQVKLPYLKPLLLEHPLASVATDESLYEVIKDSSILHDTVSCLQVTPCGICSKCLFRAKYGI